MPSNEKYTNKQYTTIGEVAQLFNVSTSLIRYWEKSFQQLKAAKTHRGIRKYTQADIAQFGMIYSLIKEQGYTLWGAKKVLKHNSQKLQNQTQLLQTLKTLRAFLVELHKNVVAVAPGKYRE